MTVLVEPKARKKARLASLSFFSIVSSRLAKVEGSGEEGGLYVQIYIEYKHGIDAFLLGLWLVLEKIRPWQICR